MTALEPLPECSVDTEDYGTLILRALSQQPKLVDLESLATLIWNNEVKEWQYISLWDNHHHQEQLPNVLQILQHQPALRQRLQQVLSETSAADNDRDQQLNSLMRFQRQSAVVFGELCKILGEKKQPKSKTPSNTTTSALDCRRLLLLNSELERIEIQFHKSCPLLELRSDLSQLTIQMSDEANRRHELTLDICDFPNHCSTLKTCIPAGGHTSHPGEPITKKAKPSLLQLVANFKDDIQECQELWNQLDDLDQHAWVLEPATSRASCRRSLYLREGAKMILGLDRLHPCHHKPSAIFLGRQSQSYQQEFQNYTWPETVTSIRAELERCFGHSLARPGTLEKLSSDNVDCAICFEALQANQSTGAACENQACARRYHAACLNKWLASLPATRTSFDTLIGSCPYCKHPIAVAVYRGM
jgi:hypothetical protein